MYDVNLRFANKWILTFAFSRWTYVSQGRLNLSVCLKMLYDPVTAWIWRGSFSSHCLRGISTPLSSIFLIWNMSSIHYEEWSRRLGYMQLRIRWNLCQTTACQWPIHSAAAAFCGERVSALFYSLLGFLGVALGIATSIVVDVSDFNFSTYHYFILFHINLNAKKCATDKIMSYAKTVYWFYCACTNSYTCLPERSSPNTKTPPTWPPTKIKQENISRLLPFQTVRHFFPTPGRFRPDEAAIAALPSLAKADDPGEVPPSTSDGNWWKFMEIY